MSVVTKTPLGKAESLRPNSLMCIEDFLFRMSFSKCHDWYRWNLLVGIARGRKASSGVFKFITG
jgi:hypothetical protein